jgi:hypothetical protein
VLPVIKPVVSGYPQFPAEKNLLQNSSKVITQATSGGKFYGE